MEVTGLINQLESITRDLGERVKSYCESSSLWDQYVDPRPELIDRHGTEWLPVGASNRLPVTTAELKIRRDMSRWLCEENPFAICAQENRASYVVGWGFTYKAVAKAYSPIIPDQVAAVQDVIDRFIEVNNWHERQQEKVKRADRDGEYFLRYFAADDGILRVRFVEPEHITEPSSFKPNESHGIRTLPEDIETVTDYYVNQSTVGSGEWIPADQIQHVKRNADSADKRGKPTYWPVRKNLVRATNMLRNMGTVTEIQTAIAMIRKHANAVKSVAQAFVDVSATRREQGPDGQTNNYKRFAPGTVLDASDSVTYEFPAQNLDPSKPVGALQAELRAIASRLVMPEFMLTADASNANFASTMVAEGPAVKNFQRLQYSEVSADMKTMMRAIRHAEYSGLLPVGTTDQVKFAIEPPSVQVRDGLKEAQTAQIYLGQGILSPQTATTQIGLDYEQEQANLKAHEEANGGVLTNDRPPLPPVDPNQVDPQLDPLADPPADPNAAPAAGT